MESPHENVSAGQCDMAPPTDLLGLLDHFGSKLTDIVADFEQMQRVASKFGGQGSADSSNKGSHADVAAGHDVGTEAITLLESMKLQRQCHKARHLSSDSAIDSLCGASDSVFESGISCPRIRVSSHPAPLLRSKGCIFTDTETLKNKMRNALLDKESYDPHMYYSSMGWAQSLARDNRFDRGSLAVVALNCLWIAVDIEFNTAPSLPQAHWVFQAAAHVFAVFFAAEIVIRFLAFEKKRNIVYDFSFLFDLSLSVLMWVETYILYIVQGGTSMQSIAGLRLLRGLRVLRAGRLVRELPELLIIVHGVVNALKAITVVLLLLAAIIYMGAILFNAAGEGTAVGAQYFPTVFSAMGSLLLDCTLSGTRGGPVMRSAAAEGDMWGYILSVLIFLFVLVANITMLGVLTGLLVQTVRTTAEVEKEQSVVRHVSDVVEGLWDSLKVYDKDGDGTISEGEMEELIQDVEFCRTVHSVGVDIEGLIDMSQFIFQQFDGKLAKKDLKKVILELRGKEQAKVKHHVETRKFVHACIEEAVKHLHAPKSQ